MSEGFKTKKYDFFEIRGVRIYVHVGIRRTDDQYISSEDLEELKQFFLMTWGNGKA